MVFFQRSMSLQLIYYLFLYGCLFDRIDVVDRIDSTFYTRYHAIYLNFATADYVDIADSLES